MKRTACFASLLVCASFAAQAVAAPPVQEPSKKKANAVVRDHRTQGQAVVRDHRVTGAVVRDHRTGGVKEPLMIVDPVRPTPIVRDHRDKGTVVVRDHRGENGVVVRDHRS